MLDRDSSDGRPPAWSITARNLPEHANNPIHTDAGAQGAGFERALVAGVTSYAYCLHPVLDRFGLAFAESGEAEVRFRSPVFDGDLLRCPVDAAPGEDGEDGEAILVSAFAQRADGPLLSVTAWKKHRNNTAASPRSGERLKPMTIALEGEYSSQYAARAGDDYPMDGFVHPAVWLALGNYVFHRQLARGPWIHTRSVVQHHCLVRDGGEASVATTVVERFIRSGERAVADVVITVDNRVVATIEHEAIIDLTAR
jgi:acyl dehydratase